MEPGLNGGFAIEPPSYRWHRCNRFFDPPGEPLPNHHRNNLEVPTWIGFPRFARSFHSEDPGRSSRMNGEELR